MKTAATEKNDTKAASPKAEAPLVIRNRSDYQKWLWRYVEGETTAEPDEDQLFGIGLFLENLAADLKTAKLRRDAVISRTNAEKELAEVLAEIAEVRKIPVAFSTAGGTEYRQVGWETHERRMRAASCISECINLLQRTADTEIAEGIKRVSSRKANVLARINDIQPLVELATRIDEWFAAVKRLRAGQRNQGDGPSWKTESDLIGDYQAKIRKAWKRKGDRDRAIQESKDLQAELVKLDAERAALEASIFDPRKMKWSFEETDVEPREVKRSAGLALE